jgi:hypothetical protein
VYQQKRALVKLVVFFIISDIVNSDDSLFSRYNNVLFLVLGLNNIKHLCHTFWEYPMVIFVTYIVEVNKGETVFIQLYTLWLLHPLTLKYRDP